MYVILIKLSSGHLFVIYKLIHFLTDILPCFLSVVIICRRSTIRI